MLEKTSFFNTLLNSSITHIKSAHKSTMADKLQILDKKPFRIRYLYKVYHGNH